MKSLVLTVLAALFAINPLALAAETDSRAQVMLVGVFHFANPGLDVVKTKQVNVLSRNNQEYLKELAKRIAGFGPTVVLLEFDPDDEAELQDEYRQYLASGGELGSNEIYQLGFRIARHAGIETVHSFDERSVGWESEQLFEYMPTRDPETKKKLDALIEEITASQEAAHASKSLAELLMQSNDPEQDALNKYFYVLTNQVGSGDNYVGADAAASWWRRNFRMYAKIQEHASAGERVVVIGGQGHTAILKDLLALDKDRVAVDVRPYFGEQ